MWHLLSTFCSNGGQTPITESETRSRVREKCAMLAVERTEGWTPVAVSQPPHRRCADCAGTPDIHSITKGFRGSQRPQADRSLHAPLHTASRCENAEKYA